MSKKRKLDAHSVVEAAFGNDLHVKRVLSLANAATGALGAASFGVAAIGRALAVANQLDPKHAIKQVDRLFSNPGVDPAKLFSSWVPYVLGARKEIVVALDWTEFDADDHSTLGLYLVTSHGRATPLLWKTVRKSQIAGKRNSEEDQLLLDFRQVLGNDMKVTLLADRGFGDAKLYQFLEELGFDYVIRFRSTILVTSADGEARLAKDWLPKSGRTGTMRDVKVTKSALPVPAFVFTKAKAMKEPWFLATSLKQVGSQIVKLYGRRFSIEEAFRDLKDPRFGRGLNEVRISSPERRDRILLVAALALALLTLLGAAGEEVGLDRTLRANTSKARTHSLFFQGSYYYAALPNMKEHRALPLLEAFEKILAQHPVFGGVSWVL